MMKWKGFERKWSWLNFKVLSQNLPGRLRKTIENLRIAGFWAKIWTWDFPNMKQECENINCLKNSLLQ
jgi:hypothetical protein